MWKPRIWEGIDNSAAMLLDHSNPSLDFCNVFPGGREVESCMREVLTQLLKLIIHEYCLNGEPSSTVDSDDMVEEGGEFGGSPCWCMFDSYKVKITRS